MKGYRHSVAVGVLSTLGVVALAAASVAGPPQYTITDLGTLGDAQTRARGVNNLGQIAGELFGEARSFFWEDGIMIDIGSLGGSRTLAWDINNLGQVTGQAYDAGESWRGFVWDMTTGMINLGVPGGYSRVVTYGINDAGHIVGCLHEHLG